MTVAATPVPLSEAKARLSELARRVRQQHERITLTRNGEPEAVLIAVEDLEGLEMTLEILGDMDAIARISESLAALGRGESGADLATVRRPARRRSDRNVSTEPESGTRSGSSPPRGGPSHSGFQKRSQQPSLNSAMPPWRSIRTASVNRCSAPWQAATEPAAAPTGSSTGSRRPTAPSTSSTSTTAPRSHHRPPA